jgi:acetamidase/formamidase
MAINGPSLLKVWVPRFFGRWLQVAGCWIPLDFHVGSMGVAPPSDRGPLSTVPPDVHGGNLDTRSLTVGATVYFPVHAQGALLSMGDVHAAQGEGEVGGTGIEIGAAVTVRVIVVKRESGGLASALTEWMMVTPPSWSPARLLVPSRDGARFVTTGFATDLTSAARKAVFYMTDVLMARDSSLTREEALMVVSLAADLRISQAVDMPHYSVAAHLPMGVVSLHHPEGLDSSLGRLQRFLASYGVPVL